MHIMPNVNANAIYWTQAKTWSEVHHLASSVQWKAKSKTNRKTEVRKGEWEENPILLLAFNGPKTTEAYIATKSSAKAVKIFTIYPQIFSEYLEDASGP